MIVQLVGIEYGKTKQGKDFTILHCIKETIQKDKGFGTKVETIFNFSESPLGQPMIGKKIDLVFDRGFNGKAFLQEVKLAE